MFLVLSNANVAETASYDLQSTQSRSVKIEKSESGMSDYFGTEILHSSSELHIRTQWLLNNAYKAVRSEWITPVWSVGIDPDSDGLAHARTLGIKTTSDGIDGLLPHLASDDIKIAFDATSAYCHADHAQKLKAAGVLVVDLTPAAIGPPCVPPVNLTEHIGSKAMNVNMVTCGGQATIPDLGLVGEDLVDAPHRHQGALGAVDHPTGEHDRADELGKVGIEGYEGA